MQLCLVSAVHLQQDIQSEKKERSDYKSEVNKRDNKSETDSLLSVHRRVTVPLLHGQKSLQLSGCAQPIPIATIKHFCQEKPPEPFAVCCSRIRQPAYLVKVNNNKKKDILRDQRSSDGCTYTAKNSLVSLLLLKADLMPLQSGSNVEVWNDQDTGLTVASHICIKLNGSEKYVTCRLENAYLRHEIKGCNWLAHSSAAKKVFQWSTTLSEATTSCVARSVCRQINSLIRLILQPHMPVLAQGRGWVAEVLKLKV